MVVTRSWRVNRLIVLGIIAGSIWLLMYLMYIGTGISPSQSEEVREKQKFEERLQKMSLLMKENRDEMERLKSNVMHQRNKMLSKLRLEMLAKDGKTDAALPVPKPQVNDQDKLLEKTDVQIKANKQEVKDQIPIVSNEDVVIPILITACNRPSVSRCLDRLFDVRGSKVNQFPIIVSQDCGDQATADVLKGYGDKITYVKHAPEPVPQGVKSHMAGYYKISSHYKFALHQAFAHFPNAESIIILEDDIEVAPDFLSYFVAMNDLLKKDDTLWCASAWNDNGLTNIIDTSPAGADILYRSDFFPGLGWLLRRSLWEQELAQKWPEAFWDDWMRSPAQRKDRACIRPEVSRTSTFGKKGVSGGQFYSSHLKYIKLNDQNIDWTEKDLSYLMKNNYDKSFRDKVYKLPLFKISELKENKDSNIREVRVEYSMAHSFKAFAKDLGLMTDLKSGVPRTAYMGIVTSLYNGRRVYLAPPEDWIGYDEDWK